MTAQCNVQNVVAYVCSEFVRVGGQSYASVPFQRLAHIMNCQESKDGALLPIRVKLRAQRDAVVGENDGVLLVGVRALPVDGAANRAVLQVLAAHFGCAKTDLWVARGATSRDKWIGFCGWNCEQLEAKMSGE